MVLHIPVHFLILSFAQLDTTEMVKIHPKGYKHLPIDTMNTLSVYAHAIKGIKGSMGIIWPTVPPHCIESTYQFYHFASQLMEIYANFNRHLLTIHKGPLGSSNKVSWSTITLASPGQFFSRECWFLTSPIKSFAFVLIVISFELPLYANYHPKPKQKSCQPISGL